MSILRKESFAASFYMVLGENSSYPTRANYGENRRQLRKLLIFGGFSQPKSRRSHRVQQTNHGECPPPPISITYIQVAQPPGTPANCLAAPFNGELLQAMRWPFFRNMPDHELRAIYEYSGAIPCNPGKVIAGAPYLQNVC